jgi:hypothetical protein
MISHARLGEGRPKKTLDQKWCHDSKKFEKHCISGWLLDRIPIRNVLQLVTRSILIITQQSPIPNVFLHRN